MDEEYDVDEGGVTMMEVIDPEIGQKITQVLKQGKEERGSKQQQKVSLQM